MIRKEREREVGALESRTLSGTNTGAALLGRVGVLPGRVAVSGQCLCHFPLAGQRQRRRRYRRRPCQQ